MMGRGEKCGLGVLLLVALCQPYRTQAQVGTEFAVTETSPMNGALSVPTETQITFTFSAPVDTSARYLSGLPIGLLDLDGSVVSRIHGWTVSPDLDQITLNVSNPDSSDVTWIITGARSQADERLCNPFALNYSTRATGGSWRVGGEVMMMWLTKKGDCEQYLPMVIATLLDAPVDRGGRVVAASTVSTTSYYGPAYTIEGVRPGTYWPTFFFDSNVDGDIVPLFERSGQMEAEVSVYGPDFGSLADSIVVINSDLFDIGSHFTGGSTDRGASIPEGLRLNTVYPNPFTDRMTAEFELVRPGMVTASIIDVLGRTREVWNFGLLPVGPHSILLEPKVRDSGIYLLVLGAGPSRVVRSMAHIGR